MLPIAFHGLAAYSGKGRENVLNGLSTIFSSKDIEVCVADRPIGEIGVLMQGSIRAAFSSDVWSEVSDSGKRYRKEIYNLPWMGEDLLSLREVEREINKEVWTLNRRLSFVSCKDKRTLLLQKISLEEDRIRNLKERFYEQHMEVEEISHDVWENFAKEALSSSRKGNYCEAWMQNELTRAIWVKDYSMALEFAEKLASQYNLPLVVVSPVTGIWDIEALEFSYSTQGT